MIPYWCGGALRAGGTHKAIARLVYRCVMFLNSCGADGFWEKKKKVTSLTVRPSPVGFTGSAFWKMAMMSHCCLMHRSKNMLLESISTEREFWQMHHLWVPNWFSSLFGLYRWEASFELSDNPAINILCKSGRWVIRFVRAVVFNFLYKLLVVSVTITELNSNFLWKGTDWDKCSPWVIQRVS